MKKRAKRTFSPNIYVSALYNIIWAMSGFRIFEWFGFNLPTRQRNTKHTLLTDYEELLFMPEVFDWVSEETAELLSGYQPSAELLGILGGNINLDLQLKI